MLFHLSSREVIMTANLISTSTNKVVIQVEVEFSRSMLDSEKSIQRALNEAGGLATQTLLEQFDTNGERIRMGSVSMTSKGQVECAYQTPYGEVVIGRHVYQTSRGGATFCPLEQNARIIRSATPFFAKQLSSKYAEFGARRVQNDLLSNHDRSIAHSFVQDVATTVASVASAHEEEWDYETPTQSEPVRVVSIGLDGTSILTVEDGWRQAMVGNITLYSDMGDRLHTTYIGATPEYGKLTFTSRLESEIKRIRKKYPDAIFVGVADGAKDNWPFLTKHTNLQILDFYHATEYLTKAADAIFGRRNESRAHWLSDACHRLKHNKTGPSAILKELRDYRSGLRDGERASQLDSAITYFKNQRKRMHYAQHIEDELPIGSGVTEAACKLIIKQRLGGSGMRWKEKGAAAVISLRCLTYTESRWEQFWQKIDANSYALAA
jgi:hypothetical protein